MAMLALNPFWGSIKWSKTSLKWLTVAMPLLETSERQERETRLERYGAMEDGLA